MNALQAMLAAIIREDADAMVLHVGEAPYVLAPSGTIEIAPHPLTTDDLTGLLSRVLLPEQGRRLQDFGACEQALAVSDAGDAADRFSLVAARGGDDIWVEFRRQRRTPAPAAAAPAVREPANVLSLIRQPARADAALTPAPRTPRTTRLERLLRLAAARGASALYVAAETRPVVRVDGEMATIDGEAPLSGAEVEALLLDLAPGLTRERLPGGASTEWVCDVEGFGRVRCLGFRDSRGAGGLFRMIPSRALSVEQLGLSSEILALCQEADGLVLVTGPRDSGKSTLVAGLIERINETRPGHVITVQRQIQFTHDSRRAFISQREVRGGDAALVEALRAATHEDPDVLVVEDLASADLVAGALEAADAGRLVIASLSAAGAAAALERLVLMSPPERQPRVQTLLAASLRGVVAQVLVRKTGGGRAAAREVLLNAGAVPRLIAQGDTAQLGAAIASGAPHGMRPLNESLAALVVSGAVSAQEACRKAYDRDGLRAMLQRAGVSGSADDPQMIRR